MTCHNQAYPTGYARSTFLYGEILRIARYLMCESVRTAEEHANQIPELQEASKADYSVVQLPYPDEGVTNGGYIVFRKGTTYTTNKVPVDFSGEVRCVEVPRPGDIVQKKLRFAARLLERTAPREFESFEVQRLLDACSQHDKRTPGIFVAEHLTRGAGRVEDVPEVWDRADVILQDLTKEFLLCRITGEQYQKAAAALAFFSVSPYREVLRQIAARYSSPDASHSKSPLLIPPLDVVAYLSKEPGERAPVFYSLRAATRLLRKEAYEATQGAIRSDTVFEFHHGLYRALALYRAAHEILTVLRSVGENHPSLWTELEFDGEEIRKWWVECEEARVMIAASLRQAALPRHAMWCLGRPSRLVGRSLHLSGTGFDAAANVFRDLAVQMVVPKVISDLLLVSNSARSGGQLSRWLQKSMEVVERLETSLPRAIALGDPDFLFYAYAAAAHIAQASGNEVVAAEMLARQGALQERVRNILGA